MLTIADYVYYTSRVIATLAVLLAVYVGGLFVVASFVATDNGTIRWEKGQEAVTEFFRGEPSQTVSGLE